MIRNYLKIAYRNLARNKGYSFINIGGLAVGMAVAMLIGLWVYDELTYDRYHENHDKIAAVWQNQTFNGDIKTMDAIPLPLETALRNEYGSYFKYIVMSSWIGEHSLTYDGKKYTESGGVMQEDAPKMLSLQMLAGVQDGLEAPNSIMLNASTSQAIFGDQNPIGKIVKLDDEHDMEVTGVYEDIAANGTTFHELGFITPWSHYAQSGRVRNAVGDWGNNSFQLYVQLADNVSMAKASAAIRDAKLKASEKTREYKPEIFLFPMNDWHLYGTFENGVQAGGRIEYVWLFGIIGVFVLLLACINFMNLSTARSEKRAREVGIRKAVGSLRGQLISQFLSESFLVVGFALIVALLLVVGLLPLFNNLAAKEITYPWSSPYFWGAILLFSTFTALLAGSYPALYLSSFQPVKVLKGTFRMGRFAALPRKVLVVIQFTVSAALVIGTIVVFKQVQFTKNRPVGYDRAGLVQIPLNKRVYAGKYNFMRQELLNSGAVEEMSFSNSPTTGVNWYGAGFSWTGKPASLQTEFAIVFVTHDYPKSMGLKFVAGRDFSRKFATDSSAIILNQTAVKYMGLTNPVGTVITNEEGKDGMVIGVVEDMVMRSPYEPVMQTIYQYGKDNMAGFYNLRLNSGQSTAKNIATLERIFKNNFPDQPFEYQFVDEEYAAKFAAEERIGKLAGVFTGLAILISCLGLFGLASYVAEQRTKEIGVRKVLGASVASLWRLLSKDFVLLVLIALLIAVPLAWCFMDGWLQKYTYRTELSWWIFAAAGAGALTITLLTVSFQAVKAALMNPVKSLRSE